MNLHLRSAALPTAVLLSLSLSAWAEDKPTEKIPHIGPTSEVTKLFGDFKFTEGPAADGKGNLYFSDIPANKIYKVDAAGSLSTFLEPSGVTNGLMINAKGNIVACQMEGQVVEIDVATKKITPLATQYKDKRFNAPNDLVVDSAGGVYFTDPPFRAPTPNPQDKLGVYYRAASGEVARLVDDLKAPNGVILSPDEKTLYVVPTLQKEMMAYPVQAPGKIGAGKVFCTLQQPEGKDNTGGDGLTIDSQGNLYVTSGLGIQVFSSAGKMLGLLKFPEQPANCTFGGPDNKTLYVTARTSLYAMPMEATGHVFGKLK